MGSDPFDRGYTRGFEDAMKQVTAKGSKRSDGKTPLRTIDDVRKLSAEQCIERRAEVDAVLEAAR